MIMWVYLVFIVSPNQSPQKGLLAGVTVLTARVYVSSYHLHLERYCFHLQLSGKMAVLYSPTTRKGPDMSIQQDIEELQLQCESTDENVDRVADKIDDYVYTTSERLDNLESSLHDHMDALVEDLSERMDSAVEDLSDRLDSIAELFDDSNDDDADPETESEEECDEDNEEDDDDDSGIIGYITQTLDASLAEIRAAVDELREAVFGDGHRSPLAG